MAPLKYACGCLGLAVGTEILGWFGIISGILYMVNNQTELYPEISSPTHPLYRVVTGIFQIIISFCLICGARTKNKSLLLPWMIINAIGILFISALLMIGSFHLAMAEGRPIFIYLLLVNILSGYFLMIVVSLYTEIGENSKKVLPNCTCNSTGSCTCKDEEVV